MKYDIAIIGTGPAGVSAAITAKIRGKTVLLLGSAALSPKITKAHRIDNYPGLPAVTGAELAEHLRGHLSAMDISVTESQVGAVYAMGDWFGLQAGEEMLEARAVIAATGVVQGKLLAGEDEFLGRGVSCCATCDGRFYKGKTVAVIGQSAEAPAEAEYLAEIAQNVLYFPVPAGGGTPAARENITVINEKPLEIIGENAVTGLRTDKAVYGAACVFVLRDAVMPDKLFPGAETDGVHLKVDNEMRTNIPGLFACGDVAGKPYQYIKAAGQGNIAALSAVNYLRELDNK